jgi:hypothetical protein
MFPSPPRLYWMISRAPWWVERMPNDVHINNDVHIFYEAHSGMGFHTSKNVDGQV